ncbi:GyrI-like domain-containing protein [Notoacmeibacter ruber]
MRDIHETAKNGASLTIPVVRSFEPMTYLAIAVECAMADLPQAAPSAFPRLHRWCEDHGVELGEGLFRYFHFTADGRTLVHVANLVDRTVAIDDDAEIITGEMAGGDYAVAVHTGPYDLLYDSTVMMDGWLSGRNLAKDERRSAQQFEPACQVEIYRNGPWSEPNPAAWETELRMKLA